METRCLRFYLLSYWFWMGAGFHGYRPYLLSPQLSIFNSSCWKKAGQNPMPLVQKVTNKFSYAYWCWLELVKFYSSAPLPSTLKKISPVLWRKTGKPKIMGIDFASSLALSEWSSSLPSFSMPSWHIVLYVYFKCFSSNHCAIYLAEESWAHWSQVS